MERNRWAVLIGGVTTGIATAVLFLLPTVLPTEALKVSTFRATGVWLAGKPFTQLRLLGGVPGGFVAGYLADDHLGNPEWGTSMKAGAYGATLGLVLVWTTFVLYAAGSSILARGMGPPPIYLIVVTPLISAIPLIPAYLLEGLAFGVAGAFVRLLFRSG